MKFQHLKNKAKYALATFLTFLPPLWMKVFVTLWNQKSLVTKPKSSHWAPLL